MKKIFFIGLLLMIGFLTQAVGQSPKHLKAAQLIESRKAEKAHFNHENWFELNANRQANPFQKQVSKATVLSLRADNFSSFLNAPEKDINLALPMGKSKPVELELTQVNIVANGFNVQTGSGSPIIDAPTGYFYRGTIKGDPNSLVAISVFSNHVRGLIADDSGNYVLARINREATDYVLYNDKDLREWPEWTCNTDTEDYVPSSKGDHHHRSSGFGFGCARVYIECDNALYNSLGSDISATAEYVLGLFHESATIYANELIGIELSEIKVWDVNDPYNQMTSTVDILPAFESDNPSFNGDLAHLLTSRVVGGGLAYLNGLYNGAPYAVSGSLTPSFNSFPNYSWEVNCFSHEMGHNFGSPHTHDCAWNGNNTPIDDCGNFALTNNSNDDDGDNLIDELDEAEPCYTPGNAILPSAGGTIMSYCYLNAAGVGTNFSNGFGPQPGSLMRILNAFYYPAGYFSDCSCDLAADITVPIPLINISQIPPAVYTASSTITSSGEVLPGDPVVIQAGDEVILLEGFEANGSFIAVVGDEACDPAPAPLVAPPTELIALDLQKGKEKVANLAVTPNPFQDHIQIRFEVPSTSTVEVKIFNHLGQLVDVVLDQEELDKGPQQVDYQGDHLISGVYHIILKIGAEQFTQKVVRLD